MTDKQPEALRLADRLDLYAHGDEHQRDVENAAVELRRLHEVNAELVEALSVVIRGVPDTWEGVKQAKVVLDKAKEQNNE